MRFVVVAALASLAACASHRAEPGRPAPSPRPETRGPRPAPLTPDVVLATIRGDYLPGVRRCYHRYLKAHDGARGRVIVSFTVDATGRAREGAARGVAHQVDGCIVAQVARWRFPPPAGGADERFALGLDLVQD